MTNTAATEKFRLAPLPYDMKALAPYVSEETLLYHHDKHTAAYVAKLNELIAGTLYEGMALEEIIRQADGPLFNNAAQAWNHDFYFATLSPAPQRMPSGPLLEAVNAAFGDTDSLRQNMTQAAVSLFGSGWVWLAADDKGALSIVSKSNAGNPLTDGLHPLLAIDVWEHAYYIDYRNARADAVKALWQVIDWKAAVCRYDALKRR